MRPYIPYFRRKRLKHVANVEEDLVSIGNESRNPYVRDTGDRYR